MMTLSISEEELEKDNQYLVYRYDFKNGDMGIAVYGSKELRLVTEDGIEYANIILDEEVLEYTQVIEACRDRELWE